MHAIRFQEGSGAAPWFWIAQAPAPATQPVQSLYSTVAELLHESEFPTAGAEFRHLSQPAWRGSPQAAGVPPPVPHPTCTWPFDRQLTAQRVWNSGSQIHLLELAQICPNWATP